MNDTITHLVTKESVQNLIQSVRNQLADNGRFIMTFRDYSGPMQGSRSIIPVRSDRDHIFTCILDYRTNHVTVTDMLYEWNGTNWEMRSSSYQKLSLSPVWLIECLEMNGFSTNLFEGPSGLVCVTATLNTGK
jgi:hypothetical protein